MEQSAAVGGDALVVAGAGAERGAELVMPSTEPLGGRSPGSDRYVIAILRGNAWSLASDQSSSSMPGG